MRKYAAAYHDTNGVGRLVGDPNTFDTKEEAQARITAILASQRKLHNVEYCIITYTSESKDTDLTRAGIVG